MSIPDLVRYYSARATEYEDVYLKPERQDSLATPAHFVIGDAFALDRVDGQFDAAFVGFWWSHLLREMCGDFFSAFTDAFRPVARS